MKQKMIKVSYWCDMLSCEVGAGPASSYGFNKEDCPEDCHYKDND